MAKDDPNTYTNTVASLGQSGLLPQLLKAVIAVSEDEDTKRLAYFKETQVALNSALLDHSFTESSLLTVSFGDLLLFTNYRFNVIDLHMGIAILLLRAKAEKWGQYNSAAALSSTLTSEDEKIFYKIGGVPIAFQRRFDELKRLAEKLKLDEVSNLQNFRNRLAHPLFKEFKLDGDEGMQKRKDIAKSVLGSFNELSGIKQFVISHLQGQGN